MTDNLNSYINLFLNDGTIKQQLNRLTADFGNLKDKIKSSLGLGTYTQTLGRIGNNIGNISNMLLKFSGSAESIRKIQSLFVNFGGTVEDTAMQIDALGQKLLDIRQGRGDTQVRLSLNRLGVRPTLNPSDAINEIILKARQGNYNDSQLKQILQPLNLYNDVVLRLIKAQDKEYETVLKSINSRETLTNKDIHNARVVRETISTFGDAVKSSQELLVSKIGSIIDTKGELSTGLKSVVNVLGGSKTFGAFAFTLQSIGLLKPSKSQDTAEKHLKNIDENTEQMTKQFRFNTFKDLFGTNFYTLKQLFFGKGNTSDIAYQQFGNTINEKLVNKLEKVRFGVKIVEAGAMASSLYEFIMIGGDFIGKIGAKLVDKMKISDEWRKKWFPKTWAKNHPEEANKELLQITPNENKTIINRTDNKLEIILKDIKNNEIGKRELNLNNNNTIKPLLAQLNSGVRQ